MSDFLLLKLVDDEIREVAKELIAKLPEGVGRIVSVADAAELLTQSETLEFIPDPDYGAPARAAKRSWFRNNNPRPSLRTFIRG